MNITVASVNDTPVITSVTGPTAQVQAGTATAIAVTFTDDDADTHTATFTWGNGITSTTTCAANGCTGSATYATAGIYDVTIVVTDAAGAIATTTFVSVIVYAPNAGSITGGGWFSTTSGKANVNINVNKYLPNQTTPTGHTKLDLAGLTFTNTSHDWLVVSGTTATWRGKGTVNGTGNYTFTATAVDDTPDAFRIRIWDTTTNTVIYDTTNPQPLGGGSIVIHKGK